MTFDLHLLTGEPALFGPNKLPAADLAQAVGPRVHSAPAGWVSPGAADHGHDFLLADSRRVAVMARTLATDFGGQAEPCLVLPSLMGEGRRGAVTAMLAELAEALARLGEACRLVLHAVSLPDRPDPLPKVQALRDELRGLGLRADLAEAPVIRPDAGTALGEAMRRNLLLAAADGKGAAVSEALPIPRPVFVRPTGRRIAFVIDRLARRSGGAERVLIETANALASRGHQVEVITHEHLDAPPFYRLAPGVVLSNLRPPQRSLWRKPIDQARRLLEGAPDVAGLDRLAWLSRHGGFWRRLGAHLRAVRPDVAVAFLPPAISALALAEVDRPMRRVASIHNVPEQDYANPERWDPSRLDRRRRLELLSRFDRITVLLPQDPDWFAPELRPSIAVMPNAVAPVAPERLAGAERGPVVMAVGRLAGVKRHDLLIRAWARVAPSFPGWELRIWGDGPLREELQAMADATGLSSLRLMGHTSDILGQYLSSSVLAHPAEFEGFGLAVAEALAAGLPVVGFEDCSGLNALVEDGVNGVLVPAAGDRVESYAAALAALMADGERRRALGAAGPGSVAAYRPEAIAGMWEELLFGDALPRRADAAG